MTQDPKTESGRAQPSPAVSETPLYVVRRMRRAFLSMCRCGDTLFSPYGMTTDQYALMRAVQREPGMRQADLGNVIFAEPNTVTAMVALLEKRGILKRKSSATDGRVRLVYLTARGAMVMQRLSDDWDPMRQLLNECFAGPAGQEALKILDRIYEEMRGEREKMTKPQERGSLASNSPLLSMDNRLASVKAPRPSNGAKQIKQKSAAPKTPRVR